MIPHECYSPTSDRNLITDECGEFSYTPKLDTDS